MSQPTQTRIARNAAKDSHRPAQRANEQSSLIDDLRMQEIFGKRAASLAADIKQDHSTAATSVLVFKLGKETYGAELRHVAQVFPNTRITLVPGAPERIAGVANLQGEVRSVFGLRRLLALPDGDDEANRYILLLRQNDRRVGLQVECLESVQRLALDHLSEHEDASADKRSEYVKGVTPDKVIILKTDELFEC